MTQLTCLHDASRKALVTAAPLESDQARAYQFHIHSRLTDFRKDDHLVFIPHCHLSTRAALQHHLQAIAPASYQMECTDTHALPPDLTNRIPAELVLHILDEAGDDHATLWACLYVCQAWYVLLIPRLYERIHLHRRAELDKLASAARAHSAVRARLASTCTVTLSRRKRHEPRFAHAFPLVLGPYLRGVAHLAFRACLLRPLHPSFFAALSQLTNVRHLKLFKFCLGSFYELQRVICAFLLLEEVHLAESKMRPRTRQQTRLYQTIRALQLRFVDHDWLSCG